MAIEPSPPTSPGVDLDEFLRSLSRGNEAVVPQQGSDQHSSYLPNTHQGHVVAEASMQLAAAGTVVATLGAVDAAGQIVTYALAEPSALFEVVGNQVLLRQDVSAADAALASHQLSVTATTSGAVSHTEVISVTVYSQKSSCGGGPVPDRHAIAGRPVGCVRRDRRGRPEPAPRWSASQSATRQTKARPT